MDVSNQLTWPALVTKCPELLFVEKQAQQIAEAGATWSDYRLIKDRLLPLVGWQARRPELRDGRFWDLAFDHLVATLEV
jgi:hypothetical protein